MKHEPDVYNVAAHPENPVSMECASAPQRPISDSETFGETFILDELKAGNEADVRDAGESPTNKTKPKDHMKTTHKITTLIAISAGLMAQPIVTTAHAEGCENVVAEGVANVGFVVVAPGVVVLGGLPTPVVIGGVPGLLSSVTTSARPSGVNGQGAQHFGLIHTFVSTDPARPGGFTTDDRAVFAPAGKDPNVGHINDVLEVVSGTGVFANADGFLKNTATLNLNTFTLTFSIHGRVCGDGL